MDNLSEADLSANLVRRTAAEGSLITLLGQFFRVATQLSCTIYLAREITPQDYGTYGAIAAIIMLGEVFCDLGLSTASIQATQIDNDRLSKLFWLNIAASGVCTISTIGLSGFFSVLFKSPALGAPLVVLSSTYLISGSGFQHLSLLKRQCRFMRIAQIDLAAMLIGCLIGVVAATLGAKLWALVYMQIAMDSVSTVGYWIASGWWPLLPKRSTSVTNLTSVAANLTAVNLLNYLTRNLDDLLIALFCGPIWLGLYDKAFQLHMLPTQHTCWPVGGVVISTLSRLKGDSHEFNKFAANATLFVSSIAFGIIVFIAMRADLIVSATLGSAWHESANLFRLLAPAAVCEAIFAATAWLFISAGQTKPLMQFRFVQAMVMLTGMLASAKWGCYAIAVALTASKLFTAVPFLLLCSRKTGVHFKAQLLAALTPAVPALFAAIGISFLAPHGSGAAAILADAGLFYVIYIAFLLRVKLFRETIWQGLLTLE